ncbi:MAG: hypothetical protein KUG58_04295 [Marinosulfonomonas sp.]|nr:hypothetical protein [Marinosulfonomonas sp.]
MTPEFWNSVLSRITPSQPVDLDASIFDAGKHQPSPVTNIAANDLTRSTAPSAMLWQDPENRQSCIGVRVDEPLADCTVAATRLAAAALERGVTPIMLTTLPDCGFERFGFRVERLVGQTRQELEICEKELMQFWNMAIVIDVKDIALLG